MCLPLPRPQDVFNNDLSNSCSMVCSTYADFIHLHFDISVTNKEYKTNIFIERSEEVGLTQITNDSINQKCFKNIRNVPWHSE